MNEILISKPIPELEREMLYCQCKADTISDLMKAVGEDYPLLVTLGFEKGLCINFHTDDLYSPEMSLSLLGTLEQLFRIKAKRIHELIQARKTGSYKLISDGYNSE